MAGTPRSGSWTGSTGKPTDKPFHYTDKGNLATVSRFSAVADIGRFQFSGFFAWLIWLAVHLFYIIGFKKRLTTLLHWTVSFLGRSRSERAVTEQQAMAREALELLGRELERGPAEPPASGRRSRRGGEPRRRHADGEGARPAMTSAARISSSARSVESAATPATRSVSTRVSKPSFLASRAVARTQ